MSCSHYEMHNMWGDYISVDEYILLYKYKPVFCKGNLIKIINPSPKLLTSKDIQDIKNSIQQDTIISRRGFDTIVYKYSYLITDYPIDVYSINSQIHGIVSYIRKDIDTIIPNLSIEGWVTSECDR